MSLTYFVSCLAYRASTPDVFQADLTLLETRYGFKVTFTLALARINDHRVNTKRNDFCNLHLIICTINIPFSTFYSTEVCRKIPN